MVTGILTSSSLYVHNSYQHQYSPHVQEVLGLIPIHVKSKDFPCFLQNTGCPVARIMYCNWAGYDMNVPVVCYLSEASLLNTFLSV